MGQTDWNLRLINSNEDQGKLFLESFLSRNKMELPDVNQSVGRILHEVHSKGDAAVLAYTEQFDHLSMLTKDIPISSDEIEAAVSKLDASLIASLEAAAEKIREFHQAQMNQVADVIVDDKLGRRTALRIKPLSVVGLYVPGGTAPLPSSVLMNAIPAKTAGVKRLVLCTPPGPGGTVAPVILAAARIAGVDEIYRVGGAQAVAAMAYGTDTIPAVDKIVGPGNIYVNTAKRMVYGTVDIDMFAGPSELLIIADSSADADLLAADLLSQAEHDKLASAILLTDSAELASRVRASALRQAALRSRQEILRDSLRDYAAVIVTADLDQAVQLCNRFAPEHLELCMPEEQAYALLDNIENAAAVFIGYYSPEPLGDYWAGPNHVLPTSGTARFFSPLNCSDFIKKTSLIHYSKAALQADGEHIMCLAEAEGLDCHAESIRIRMDD